MIVDIFLIIIIVISALIGKHRGFIKCLIGVVSMLVSIILALLLYKPLGNFIMEKTQLDDNIEGTLYSKIMIDDVEIKAKNNLPNVIDEQIEQANNSINETKNNLTETVSKKMTIQIIYGISFILIFIIIKILTLILTIISKIVEKIPFIKQINEIGGLICGIIYGIAISYIIITVISIISPLINNTLILEMIEKSYITSFIYNNNLILKVFIK